MKQIVSTRTMRESDAKTIEQGTSGRVLMQRAAKGIFDAYRWQGRTAIVCGSGNNAGDGYALACLLSASGIDCQIFLLSDRFSADGAYFYGKCKEIGVKVATFSPQESFDGYAEIVDCVFGTGFRGTPEGLFADAIRAINRSDATVISADINSGLNGDNGLATLAVRSDLTVSIGSYQYGHFLGQAKDLIQDLTNVDIGIEIEGEFSTLIEANDVRAVLGTRPADCHKGNFGYVSILGGCREYAGAIKLASLGCAALRAGCGVAKLIIPESIYHGVSPYLLETTAAPLPDTDGHIRFDAARLDEVLAGQRALAIGMGWGKSPENARILEYLLKHYDIPIVIDADGLNTLATMNLSVLQDTKCRVILTPHPKEMERLSGISVAEIRQNPVGVSMDFARKYGVTVLLKGTCTVVTDGASTHFVNRGCAGMATAGSGDVLSGILVGLLGYAPPTALTVAAGAWIAGRAGELAEKYTNSVSMLASDTFLQIAAAISEALKV